MSLAQTIQEYDMMIQRSKSIISDYPRIIRTYKKWGTEQDVLDAKRTLLENIELLQSMEDARKHALIHLHLGGHD
jgi:hypothetical protein